MATYCVIFQAPTASRAVRFYLKAPSADRAFAAAVEENPKLHVLGIETADRAPFTQNHLRAA